MNLRKKTISIIVVTLVTLMGILYLSSRLLIRGGFKDLEKQNAILCVKQVKNIYKYQLSSLDALTHDWSSWDDSYEFIKNKNSRYIKSNLVNGTFSILNLNLMMFVDHSGKVVYSTLFDLRKKKRFSVPRDLKKQFQEKGIPFARPDTQTCFSGIVSTSAGPLIISSRPILTSEDKGPARGTLIFGQYLDSTRVSKIASLIDLPLTILSLQDSRVPSVVRSGLSVSKGEPIYVTPVNSETMAGYSLVRDLSGKPAFVMRINISREIFEQSLRTMFQLITSIIFTGLIFAIVIILILERLVISRISHLGDDVNAIRSSRDLSARVSLPGKDELSNLAKEINTMLEALEKSRLELQKSEEELREHREHLEELVEQRTTELRRAKERFRLEVDERKRAEEALKSSEEKYRTMIEYSNDLIWTLDKEGNFSYVNKRAEEVSGYRLEDWIGKSFAPMIPPKDLPRIVKLVQETLAGKPVHYEVDVLRADGSIFVLSVNAAPFYSKGEVVGVANFGHDITDSKQAEIALRDKDRDIRRAYVDVFGAVTGGRLVIMAVDEINSSLGEPVTDTISIGSFEELSDSRAKLKDSLMSQFPQFDAEGIVIAANEALTNAIKHGRGGEFQVFQTNGVAQILIRDFGPGIDFKTLPKATLISGYSTKQTLGVGFSLILDLCDRVLLSTQPGKTEVVLEKKAEGY